MEINDAIKGYYSDHSNSCCKINNCWLLDLFQMSDTEAEPLAL